jgi:muramoyltetrapeptide carboxypeptidase
MPIKPVHLEFGDTLGIVAPASAPPDPESIDRAVQTLQRLGFKPKLGRNARKRHGFLAGQDAHRAGDIMAMFADTKVNGILCVRGGYGSSRLLNLLDYPFIARHAKILIGYSDITALHCALLSKANLISFHGPMLNSDFVRPDMPDFTLQSFLRVLMNPVAPGGIRQDCATRNIKTIRPGTASGRLLGGNLSILCSTLGTPFQPSFRNKILFLEDVDEVPYRVDRMLTQLLNAGLLQQVAGIAIGTNKNCKDPKAKKSKEYRQTLYDVFCERLLPLKVPIVSGLPFGHVGLNATIPVGARAALDATNGDLLIAEPAVR